MKNKIEHTLIFLFYSSLFFITKCISESINYFSLVLFSIGLLIGLALMYLDEFLLYKYYADESLKNRHLITRSFLFIVALFPLGLFIITSTGSELGTGLFLGIITKLMLELIQFRNDEDFFHIRFMSQLKRKLEAEEIKIFVSIFIFLTMVFSLLVFVGK